VTCWFSRALTCSPLCVWKVATTTIVSSAAEHGFCIFVIRRFEPRFTRHRALGHLEITLSDISLGASKNTIVQGRKMSKSIGNVVDPLDIIGEYGTDALRYTLATGTTPGQDINLSMERVTSSRNLLNKLWNATKYVLVGIDELSAEDWQALAEERLLGAQDLVALPLSERWIVSRLHSCAAPLWLPSFVLHR
jgi:hypothetical protein